MPRAALDAALAACRDDDDVRALGLLVEAWRASRTAEIGDAIVALGPRAARHVTAPTGETRAELAAAWLDAARAGDPAMRGALLLSAAEGGLGRLLELGDDPRVARAIADRLADPKLGRTAFSLIDRQIKEIWKPMTALLIAARDTRALATLVAAHPLIVGRVPPARRADATMRIDAIIHGVRHACAANVPLDADARALVDAILAHARAPLANVVEDAAIEAALLADVYRAPDDDGPRMVYADWLTERGRARGEFITLQLAAANRTALDHDRAQRAAALRDVNLAEYLGPLAPHVTNTKFARGFVTACRVARVPPPEDAAWATVTEIRGGLPATDACPMPALRVALDLSAADLARLASLATPPPLETLELRNVAAAAGVHYTAVAPRLPHLRALAWYGTPVVADLAFALHARPLDGLEVVGAAEHAVAWFEALEASAVTTLVLHALPPRDMGSWVWKTTTIEIARGDAGWTIAIEAVSGTDKRRLGVMLDGLLALVARVPRIAKLALRVPAADAWSAANRERVRAALDAHPAIAAHEIPNLERRR